MLAKDVEACAALLQGEPVDPDRLDANWLAWAVSRRLVRLDERAIGRLFAWAGGPWSLPPELLCAECGQALIESRKAAA
jgi:hypothetical protein